MTRIIGTMTGRNIMRSTMQTGQPNEPGSRSLHTGKTIPATDIMLRKRFIWTEADMRTSGGMAPGISG